MECVINALSSLLGFTIVFDVLTVAGLPIVGCPKLP